MLRPRTLIPLFSFIAVLLLLSPLTLQAYPRDWDLTIAKEARFDVGNSGALVVDVPDADVIIESGSSGEIAIEIEVASSNLERALDHFEEMEFSFDEEPGRIEINARAPRTHWNWRGSTYAVTVRVSLPENFNIEVQTNDGDIDVQSVTGALHLKTSDGDIKLNKINSPRVLLDTSDGDILLGQLRAPDVQIETSDGTIEADGLYGDDIDIRTSDGDIYIDALSGGLNAMTTDGDIRVQIDDLQRTTLRSGDGDITVIMATTLNANVDFHADDLVLRQVDLNFKGELSEHRARGKLNGGGPRLQASTRDGSLTLSTGK